MEEENDEVLTLDESDETEIADTTEVVVDKKLEMTQEELDSLIESRISRVKKKYEREFAEKEQVIKTVQAGVGEEDLGKLKNTLKDFYKNEGIEVPEYVDERKERILAKADAEDIIDDGYDEMEKFANLIASKPSDSRTLREKVMFDVVCEKLIEQKSINDLKKSGIDIGILENKDFKQFAKKFSSSTPILEIHDMYSKINKVVEKPQSTGSVKSTEVTDMVKEYYTPDEVRKLTSKDLDNPKIMKAVEDSMTKW